MGCKARYGIRNVCGDLLFPSGADKGFWVGYVSDLATQLSSAQSGIISALPAFVAYSGLVYFEGQKYSHVFSTEGQKAAGGNRSIIHRSTVKLISLSTQDDVEIQALMQAEDAFVIYRDNNEQFFISGYRNGLAYAPGPLQSTGQTQTDDVTDTVILEGVEKTKPLRFLVTDVPTTVAYLNARLL